jgi:hypothetical protein
MNAFSKDLQLLFMNRLAELPPDHNTCEAIDKMEDEVLKHIDKLTYLRKIEDLIYEVIARTEERSYELGFSDGVTFREDIERIKTDRPAATEATK